MAKNPSKKFRAACIVLLAAIAAVATVYMYNAIPRIMLAPWLMSDGGFASIFGL